MFQKIREGSDSLGKTFLKFLNPIIEKKSQTKILVFCQNKTHLKAVRKNLDKKFKDISQNRDIKISEYHTGTTEDNFYKFKNYNSNCVKILYVIDKFNEGIHLDDLDAIILLRRTTSDIIYYLQIGRILGMGKQDPLIIDLVNNFSSIKNYKIWTDVDDHFKKIKNDNSNSFSNKKEKETEKIYFYNYVKDFEEVFVNIDTKLSYGTIYTTKNGESGTLYYFANKYKINSNTLNTRINRKKLTIDEALNIKVRENKKRYITKDGESGTLEYFAEKYDTTVTTLYLRMRKKSISIDEALNFQRSEIFTTKDGESGTAIYFAEKYNIKEFTLRSWIKNSNMTINEALNHQIKEPETLTMKDGESGTFRYFSEKYNIGIEILRKRIKNRNMTIDEALIYKSNRIFKNIKK